MASPPHSGVPSGAVSGSSNPHDHLLMQQQQQQQVDYYQNPAAIYSQMQQQSHYGNTGSGSADLLATQQYLQNLHLGGGAGDPNMDGSGKKMNCKFLFFHCGFCFRSRTGQSMGHFD